LYLAYHFDRVVAVNLQRVADEEVVDKES